jgi:osmotically-inducible protein OsmY
MQSLNQPQGEKNMYTDAQVKQNVVDELKWEPSVNATQIGVEVKDGIVTLSGHVDSYVEKCSAKRAALRVAGVKALAVEIDVKLPGVSKRNDTDIARSVENILKWSAFLPADSVKVVVSDGWVTLSGQVDSDYQRRGVADTVRPLMGVTGVTNNVVVKAKASASAIKSSIEAALKRRAIADAKAILVDVKGDKVTLRGTASSWSERDLTTQAAWSTPGVRDVIDNISVKFLRDAFAGSGSSGPAQYRKC